MRLSTKVSATALALTAGSTGLLTAVAVYHGLSAPPAAPVGADRLVLAEARGPHPVAALPPQVQHRWAPCRPPARLAGGVCVTTVERTVVVTDPPPPAPAPSSAPRPGVAGPTPARATAPGVAPARAPVATPPRGDEGGRDGRDREPREQQGHDD